MKKLLSWLLCLAVVVLLLPVTPTQAAPGVTVETFILSNEKGTSGEGGLIDHLITAGYGNNSLYEILQVLQPLSGGAIPDNFMAALAACPADCDVKTAVLNNFADESNNPIGIGSDGTLLVAPIYGRSFAEDDAFSTTTGNIALAGAVQFTAADSRDDAIDAGSNTISGKTYYYKAFAIAWSAAEPTTFVLTNEAGGLIDKLVSAGHGNDSLYQVVKLLYSTSGGIIPEGFMKKLDALPVNNEIKTTALYNFVVNYPVCINSDGTITIQPIYGRDYDGKAGYASTDIAYTGVGKVHYTVADNSGHWINAGLREGTGAITYYKAFAIAWMPDAKDVPDTWALPEVREAEQRGLVPAVMQSEYTKTVTRSEFCSLAVLCVEQVKNMTVEEYIAAQNLAFPEASPFTDIAGLSQKEQADILAAYTLKIVAGTSPTTFNPNDKITREQAAKMLTSAAAALGKTTEAALPTFADGGQIASWAAPYIGYVFNAKIMNGVGGNKFDPQGGYQRQQAYMTMLRLYKYMTGAA